MFKKLFILFLLSTFYLLSPSNTFAAKIFFEPAQIIKSVEDVFPIDIRIDTEGEEINAVGLDILYPPIIEIRSTSKENSIVKLWTKEPSFTNKTIMLSGGIPGGIKTSNGVIARINVLARAIGDGTLQISPSSLILLNDGRGTLAKLSVNNIIFHIIPRPKSQAIGTPTITPEPILVIKKSKDNDKPEQFDFVIGNDPRVFDGKYFVSFFTNDTGSGLSRYEIKEGDRPFKEARSPFLLSDQSLKSVIRVRAYDFAGNFRDSIYPGLAKRIWWWIINFFSHKYSL